MRLVLLVGLFVKLSSGLSQTNCSGLEAELLTRMQSDQEIRNRASQVQTTTSSLPETLKQEWVKIDQENTAWLKQVIKDCGWPTISKVGHQAATAAWLLAQHADLDALFQRQVLDILNTLPVSEVNVTHRAYLTDRVLLGEGKKQRYGTQVELVDCRFQPRPLENETIVDKLRAEVGLEPLIDYLKRFTVPTNCK